MVWLPTTGSTEHASVTIRLLAPRAEKRRFEMAGRVSGGVRRWALGGGFGPSDGRPGCGVGGHLGVTARQLVRYYHPEPSRAPSCRSMRDRTTRDVGNAGVRSSSWVSFSSIAGPEGHLYTCDLLMPCWGRMSSHEVTWRRSGRKSPTPSCSGCSLTARPHHSSPCREDRST